MFSYHTQMEKIINHHFNNWDGGKETDYEFEGIVRKGKRIVRVWRVTSVQMEYDWHNKRERETVMVNTYHGSDSNRIKMIDQYTMVTGDWQPLGERDGKDWPILPEIVKTFVHLTES